MKRRTKIIATLGPATESVEMLETLIEAGVNVFRLNMSHAKHDWVRATVTRIRDLSKRLGEAVGILMDTQGPAIRTGDLPVSLDLKVGQKFLLTIRGERSEELHSVDVNYENFVNDINVGDTVLLDNGMIHMRVLSKESNRVECEVLTPGKLGSRRHINLPGVKVSLPALTQKDIADVALGVEVGVDYFALSFVREAADIELLRQHISHAKPMPQVVAKIEDQLAVKNLESILEVSDAIMVARGDLGIECPYEELPIIQRRIVKTCLKVGRPVIVATHMLESMIQNPMPTRAEITDVANAVFEQADAIMLSGETTVGKYPAECVKVLDKVAVRIERSGGANYHSQAQFTSPRQKIARSAVVMADDLRAQAIVVFTLRGNMARHVAWMRPRHTPIFAICESWSVANSLTLLRGVTPFVMPFNHSAPEQTIGPALGKLKAEGYLKTDDTVVIVSSMSSGEYLVDGTQMRIVD